MICMPLPPLLLAIVVVLQIASGFYWLVLKILSINGVDNFVGHAEEECNSHRYRVNRQRVTVAISAAR